MFKKFGIVLFMIGSFACGSETDLEQFELEATGHESQELTCLEWSWYTVCDQYGNETTHVYCARRGKSADDQTIEVEEEG